MKLTLMVVTAIICVANTVFAQTDTVYTDSFIHFQELLEPEYGFGDFYESLGDTPFRLGLRTGIYAFVSNTFAFGPDLHAAMVATSFGPIGSVSVGGGPGMLIVGKRHGSHELFYFNTYFHLVYNSDPSKGHNRTGVELGMHLGAMKRFGGIMYGFGMAYDVIPRYPDGFKIFGDIGLGTAVDHRPKVSKTNHDGSGRVVTLRIVSEIGYAGGGLYETVTDNRFQYGIRTGVYSYVSSVTAIGINARISTTMSERRSDGYGIGPEILFAGRSNGNSYGWHARLYMDAMSQSWTKIHSSKTNHSGGEFGISLGRSKRGGYIYEAGAAYDVISGIDNGYRIFADIGYAL